MSAGSLGSLKTEEVMDMIGGGGLQLGLNTQACPHPHLLPHHPAPPLPPPQGRQRGRSWELRASPGGCFPLRCSGFLASCFGSSCFQELAGSMLLALVMLWDS